ncbi:glycosyltransferase family A protein [Proteus terrae]|uniref:glycosyltransferase family A protein n=1 Tax=Proteus terrae TaxID=1574161 RepID=UPI00301C0665
MNIDIIITTRNSSKYIKNALDALVRQTNQNFNIIIIDDASSDFLELEKVVNNYKINLSIRLIKSTEKRNASYTRNLGIHLSKNKIIAFHDADDIWCTEKTNEIINTLSKLDINKPFLLFHSVYRCNINNINKKNIYPTIQYDNQNIIDYLINDNGVIQTSSIVINKENKVFFNEKLERHQDIQFCFDSYIKGIPFIHITKPLSYWIILDPEINAVKKGATPSFCFRWMNLNKSILTEKNTVNYIGNVLLPISFKDKSLFNTIRKIRYTTSSKILIKSIIVFTRLALKKITN